MAAQSTNSHRSWKAGDKVSVTQAGDAVGGHELLVLDGRLDVATRLGGQVDDDTARLHAATKSESPWEVVLSALEMDVGLGNAPCTISPIHHSLRDHLRRGATGNQSGGDDDVDVLALLGKKTRRSGVPLGGHLLGVASRSGAVLKGG